MHYSFEHISRLLDIPETVLARLCHVFKLPAAAFTANSRVLVQGNAPFTQADLDRLSAIHQAIMAGHPLKTIQQRFARQDAVAQRAALPTQPNFLAVLGQQAKQLPVIQLQSVDTALSTERREASKVPTETILATLAVRLQQHTPSPRQQPSSSALVTSSALQPKDTTVHHDLKALFPNALRGNDHITSQLTDVANTAKPTTRPMCPPQTAPSRFYGFPAQAPVTPTFPVGHPPHPPMDLQQAFRRRVQPNNAKAQSHPSFSAF